MVSLLAGLERHGKLWWAAVGVLLLLLLILIDESTTPEIALFYLLPVSLVTWFAGRWLGIAMAVVAATGWQLAHHGWGWSVLDTPEEYWDAGSRLGFFLVVAVLLSSLRLAMERERRLARTDYVTGAANARAFYETAQAEIQRSRRYGQAFTIAYLDLDDFKLINDRFGHATGDEVLRTVAHIVGDALRDTDSFARLGGDEFAMLLPETGQDPARIALGRLQQALGQAMRKHDWPVTFSIGAVTWLQTPRSVDVMIQAADDLMYSLKKSGKNAIVYAIRRA